MSAATKKPDDNAMADDDEQQESDDRQETNDRRARDLTGAPGVRGGEPVELRGGKVVPAGSGFFHLYKSGQGYWTRMGTAGGAALIALVTANFLYSDMGARIAYLQDHKPVALGIAGAFLVAWGLLVWWFINRPRTADFLIATDSEMKKVNWTSRKELIGSTKIVILFMFLIAFGLFAIDIIFGYIFHWIGVLKNPPF